MELEYIPSVREILDDSAKKYGNNDFIKYIENGKTIKKSFIDVREDSLALCRLLRKTLKRKTHIAVLGKTSYEYLVFSTAVLISGNVLVPFAYDISESEAVSLFDRADIGFVAYNSDFSGKKDNVFKAIKLSPIFSMDLSERTEFDSAIETYSSDPECMTLSDYSVDPDEPALMIFTSGTTGIRKGVVHSTKSFIANIMYTPYEKYLEPGTTVLSILPMYHVYCFSGDYLNNLKDGVTVALNGNMRDLAKNLLKFEPAVIRIVPMVAESLLKMVKSVKSKNPCLTHREAAERIFGRNIKWLLSGGAYLSPELADEYADFGIQLRQGYGMTEAGCRIAIPDLKCPLDSVGRVLNICNVRIQNGEIQVKTPSAMLGYYKMPEETEKMFTSDGWLRTGDIGEVNEDNMLFVTGRLKNLIILSSGENVSPEAIEKKFMAVPSVSEILVYAENDMIVADIYPDYDYCEFVGITNPEEAITQAVREMNLKAKASHIISDIRISSTPLEKTASGKIKRKGNVL